MELLRSSNIMSDALSVLCERGNKPKHKKQKLFCDRREESAQQHLTASSEPNGGRSLIKF